MLKKRIIPCLDVKDGRVVKGINFLDLVDAGDPVQQAKFYSENGADEIMIIGGGYIYNEFITVSDRLYITEVDIEVEGDAFFPKIDSSKFKEVKREEKSKKPEDDAYHSMVIYEKI